MPYMIFYDNLAVLIAINRINFPMRDKRDCMKNKILFTILIGIFGKQIFAGEQTNLERGKYIFNLSGCMNCHSPDRNKPLAGGLEMNTPFGKFYTPNISKDPKFGIGNWTDKDFIRAVKKGISPSGKFYYPFFTFSSFTKLTDEDVIAMRAYMNTLPASTNENKAHQVKFPLNQRAILVGWRALNFKKNLVSTKEEAVFKYQGTFRKHEDKSDEWNNGAYLVEAALHCTECHTPRNKIGGLEVDKWMSGALFSDEKNPAANITPDATTGLKWGREDWKTFLSDGTTPDGDDVGGEMYKVIKYGTRTLSESDMDDVITYLMDLKPIKTSLELKKQQQN